MTVLTPDGSADRSGDVSAGSGGAPGTGGGGVLGTGGSGTGGAVGTPDAGDPCAADGGSASTDPSVDCCPADPLKTRAGVCGCGVPDIDSDGDSVLDCMDQCPMDTAKTRPGICGCGMSDVDTDGDAVPDCTDGCPMDFTKQVPGICGCGIFDGDGDADGVPDCMDGCPIDAAKTAAGVCGCGKADADTDGDLVLDCMDGCPKDATRTSPGACGCGIPDTTALCLVHRYSFNDTGTIVADSIGTANGAAVNVTLTGNGSVTLAGLSSDQYVSLPKGIISSLGNSATLETWVTWNGAGGTWQRIFDFGASDAGEGMQGTGQSYLFLTPVGGSSMLRAAFTVAGPGAERVVNAPTILPTAITNQVAVVMDGTARTMSVYLNGAFQRQVTLTESLSSLNDLNNWLGRSQFGADPEFAGTLHEFRVYSAARNAAQILASFNAGPDVLPTQ